MSHYETLGVSEDATADQIKRAYRAKAKEKHPDKGGPTEDFTPIVRAYEVLSDPERRLLYDATGQDSRRPIEVEAQSALLTCFSQALCQEEDIEVLAFVREVLKDTKGHIVENRKTLKAHMKKLKARRGKIKSSGEVNVAHMIIDGEMKRIEAELLDIEHKSEVHKTCMEMLKSYSEDWKSPEPVIIQAPAEWVIRFT